MYRVKTFFTDLQDNNFAYNEGDIFPRDGKEVTPERIKELSSDANLRGISLIEEVRVAEAKTVSKEEAEATVDDEPRKRTRKRKTED